MRSPTEGQLHKTAPTAITLVKVDVYNIEMTGNFIVYFQRKCLKICLIKITKPQQLEKFQKHGHIYNKMHTEIIQCKLE